ncbi:MAG TPA: hypothetical protein VGU90_12190, partial [Terriglobales bacterium]|nr:hypothetical protein [Terriglobales bacterium]
MATHSGAGEASERQTYRFHPVTLRFIDRAVEQRFKRDHLLQALPIVRATFIGSILAYALFGVLDVTLIPEARWLATWIRYGVVCPAVFVIFCLTYTKWFPQVAQLLFAFAMLFASLGIVAMTAAAGEPGRSTYYAGIILVIIIGSSLVPVRWLVVTWSSAIIFLSYQVVVFLINPIAGFLRVNNDFFLATAIMFGIAASYLHELR